MAAPPCSASAQLAVHGVHQFKLCNGRAMLACSYGRWWEARQAMGRLLVHSRNLERLVSRQLGYRPAGCPPVTRNTTTILAALHSWPASAGDSQFLPPLAPLPAQSAAYVAPADPSLLPALRRWTAAITPSLAAYLRQRRHYLAFLEGEMHAQELDWLREQPLPPIAVLQVQLVGGWGCGAGRAQEDASANACVLKLPAVQPMGLPPDFAGHATSARQQARNSRRMRQPAAPQPQYPPSFSLLYSRTCAVRLLYKLYTCGTPAPAQVLSELLGRVSLPPMQAQQLQEVLSRVDAEASPEP